jgi:ABC-type uncharacterized transport system auxiliary subunit
MKYIIKASFLRSRLTAPVDHKQSQKPKHTSFLCSRLTAPVDHKQSQKPKHTSFLRRQESSSIFIFLSLLVILFSQSGCFWGKSDVQAPNYYVLDYLKATENRALIQAKPFEKSLEVSDAKLPRTYDRNQLVKKTSYASISYYANDLWANRLYDAVPNIISQRLNAYNIFTKCARDMGDASPDFYLETYIQNIEYIEGDIPQAFLRIELYLRKSSDQSVVFSQVNESSKDIRDPSVDFLVQTYNQMIMYETDLFAGRCIDYLSGRPIRETYKVADVISRYYERYTKTPSDTLSSRYSNSGQLYVPLKIKSEVPITYFATRIDSLLGSQETHTGIMNEPLNLRPGRYNLSLGGEQNITASVEVMAKMRSVVIPTWGELLVHIIDQNQTRVRMQYDLYYKALNGEAYKDHLSSRYSPGDEIGETDYVWIIKPGNYMITLQGESPSSLTNFTTVTIEEGKSYVETVVVNPQGGSNVLIGAGLLESTDSMARKPFHKGAIHADVNFSQNNLVNEKKPIRSINLSGQFDNKLEYDAWPFHLIVKSLYELGFNKTTDSDFKASVDDYSLKNSLVFFPYKKNKTLKNFGVYGRADINTHAFPDYMYYSSDTNFMRISELQDTLYTLNAKKLRVTDPPYPISLREGSGLTYRWTISPAISMNFRAGYGWQQDHQKAVYSYLSEQVFNETTYQVYKENHTTSARGFESSIIITAFSLFDHVSVNSTFDVLFPKDNTDTAVKYTNENLFNVKLFRNVSIDIKANAKYDKAIKDYIMTDYSAFLRVSLYY